MPNKSLYSILIFLIISLSANENMTEKIKKYNSIKWQNYTVENLKKNISHKMSGDSIEMISIQKLYFLPKINNYTNKKIWKKAGILWPKIIVLSKGRYDIQTIYKHINNSNIIEKKSNQTFIIKRPIYIAPTASLLVENSTLKLSLKHGVFIMYHGDLDVVDSTITSWDIKKNNYGKREHIKDDEILFYLKQIPRPYLLGLAGSKTKMVNSNIIGLGFKATRGTFGLSLSKSASKYISKDIGYILRKLKKPEGVFVGNNIYKCFFGFYTNNAENVFLAGNILHDNIIYNFDPHDYSTNLTIAKNISYNAAHAHGIIMSREVKESTIAQNIIFNNIGSGIMLDRNCEDNLIYKNLSFQNNGDGIAIFESSKNEIQENTILRNGLNGIFIRNSVLIDINKNFIYRNAINGIELSIVDINYLETRDFNIDPYEKYTKANILDNIFQKNINSALSVKNSALFFFKNNTLKNSGPVYFSGEIRDMTSDIFTKNKLNGFSNINLKDKK